LCPRVQGDRRKPTARQTPRLSGKHTAFSSAATTSKGKPIGIFSPAEHTKLLARAPDDLLPFLALGDFAGLRHAELLRLDWSEVDLAGRLIEVKSTKAKTASRRLVPLSATPPSFTSPAALSSCIPCSASKRSTRSHSGRCALAGVPRKPCRSTSLRKMRPLRPSARHWAW
jgi:hypothetical protein